MRTRTKAPTTRESRIIKIMVLIGFFSIINFLFFFFDPDNRGNNFLFILLSITVLYGAVKKLYMWYNYSNISTPTPPQHPPTFKVDILTTYFPGEPYQMIVTTLEAISKITYPHTAYLCDEANDPFLKKFCEENNIVHVTRDNRIDAKAGNINNALRTVATGDICVILDPDHIPEPEFLDPILPYFSDPKIGFVQIVQSYYNIKDSLVARGAAEQTFQFYGPMMMTLNSYGTVNAIGANCVFRRKALDSIGGHAPGLCEDMHTTMLLYAKKWKAVYLPEVLAKGLAPSSLTTYFKQQLKWTRGTFDLLVKVYPKVFKDLSIRQKIHFGILPLHYLCGLIYLINFLIPILSLFLSTTPWRGNIINFLLVSLPVGISAILIRTFIQKWVIEKEERGFHLVGGLLQINTWWIYLLGFLYTLVDKKVPYLPTPKQSEFHTNLKIVIPNAGVAIISIIAIIYGLYQDLTPFSVIMAGFALFNTLIMLFGIYLSISLTNQNRILRSNLERETLVQLWKFRSSLRNAFHSAFTVTRKFALPLLIIVLFSSLGFINENIKNRWEDVKPFYYPKISDNYLGIFQPSQNNGMVDLEEVNAIEARKNINFDIISFYWAWTEESTKELPLEVLDAIAEKNAVPMITWEPWISELNNDISQKDLFSNIAAGNYDAHIKDFASQLATYDHPVFLRFAHEFDNPQYPWHISSEKTATDFIAAWKRIYNIFSEENAGQVMFVWNPWKADDMVKFYPGDDYVDWIGVTLLNYGPLGEDGSEYPFSRLYQPFHENILSFTRKPVMLAEFNSVNIGGQQQAWLKDAVNQITTNFKEINAVVLFNSAFDANIPRNSWYKEDFIDWSLDSLQSVTAVFDHSPKIQTSEIPLLDKALRVNYNEQQEIAGVHYKKGVDWKDNYYVLTKETVVEDFNKIKEAGFNTIQFTAGNIYEHNVLKYADQANLKVIYRLDLEPASGYMENNKLQKLENDILDKISDFRGNNSIIAYSINFNLNEHFEKPLLFHQQHALLKWLQPLLLKIKNINPDKALYLEVPYNSQAKYLVQKIENILPIDAYGLSIDDDTNAQQVLELSTNLKAPTYISSILPETLLKNGTEFQTTGYLLENWQDERLSYRLSFDGLLDHAGRPKVYFPAITKFNNSVPRRVQDKNKIVRILKPAVPIYEGKIVKYEAVVFKDQQWIATSKLPEPLFLEWSLVKNDEYGNHLAVKTLGEGLEIAVKIPENHQNYELLLSIRFPGENYITQVRSQLHTPLLK